MHHSIKKDETEKRSFLDAINIANILFITNQ
jgi:hypothetical protein